MKRKENKAVHNLNLDIKGVTTLTRSPEIRGRGKTTVDGDEWLF